MPIHVIITDLPDDADDAAVAAVGSVIDHARFVVTVGPYGASTTKSADESVISTRMDAYVKEVGDVVQTAVNALLAAKEAGDKR